MGRPWRSVALQNVNTKILPSQNWPFGWLQIERRKHGERRDSPWRPMAGQAIDEGGENACMKENDDASRHE